MSQQIPQKLRLNFNERSDFISPVENLYPFNGTLWQYPDRQPLQQQIADIHGLTAKQVLCCNGGDEAIMILMRLVLEMKCQLILPLPVFSQYSWGVTSWQLNAQLIAANADLSINIEATLAAIKRTTISKLPETRAPIKAPATVTVITRPNNPSGELISLPILETIIEAAKLNNGWVFLDEAYIEFSEQPGASATMFQNFDNLLVLRTLSKAYGLAGIRLGYLLGPEKLIAQFTERCAPFNIAQPTLTIAADALSEDNQAGMKHYCQTIINNRQQLYDDLVSRGIAVLPSQANFLVLQLPEQQARAIASFLARNDILVRSFDDAMVNCLRITIPYQLEKLQPLLQQALTPELICLDMDGVLIDTSNSYDATTIATVKQLSGTAIGLQEIESLKARGGFNNDWVLCQKLLQNCGVDLQLDKVTEVFQKLYLGENNDGLVNNEIPIIKPALSRIITQSRKITFAIVTGRPLAEARAGQKLIGLEKLDLISLDCVEQAKPSPQGINRLQKQYSKLSWMCGDNPDDMQAAIASGSMAIGIRTINQQALYQAGADIVLNDINELESWLCVLK